MKKWYIWLIISAVASVVIGIIVYMIRGESQENSANVLARSAKKPCKSRNWSLGTVFGVKDKDEWNRENKCKCDCEAWFPENLSLQRGCQSACKDASTAPTSKNDYLDRYVGEQASILGYGIDPNPDNDYDIHDTQAGQVVQDQVALAELQLQGQKNAQKVIGVAAFMLLAVFAITKL